MKTATKAKRYNNEYFNGFSYTALRNIFHSMYTMRKEIPAIRQTIEAGKQTLII